VQGEIQRIGGLRIGETEEELQLDYRPSLVRFNLKLIEQGVNGNFKFQRRMG
jgi:hypothetical protein